MHRPYPIILGSAYQQIDNFSLFYPCEFTPEYTGIPPVYPNEQPNKTIGGGFVDTFVSTVHGPTLFLWATASAAYR
jgi:hypothetical protein